MNRDFGVDDFLAPWSERMPSRKIYGSLYAVSEHVRPDAARVLWQRGLGIHADLICAASEDGTVSHRGVAPHELLQVRRRLPEARIELHLIVDAAPGSAGESHCVEMAIGLALEIGAERLALPRIPGVAAMTSLRRGHCEVWNEVTPTESARGAVHPDATGALVMLIEPGSTGKADPSLMNNLTRIARTGPVAVDGGVTAELAQRALSLGAHHAVAGRALFDERITSHNHR